MARYDDHTGRLLAAVEAIDPDAVLLDPPAPWFGRTEPVEQLDGAKAGQLTLAVHEIEGNDFLQPWRRREPADRRPLGSAP